VDDSPERSMRLDVARQPEFDNSAEATTGGLPYPSYDKEPPVIDSLMDAKFPTDARLSERLKWQSSSDLEKNVLNALQAKAEALKQEAREEQRVIQQGREREKRRRTVGPIRSGLEGDIAGSNGKDSVLNDPDDNY
jgi:hypothetical protein